MTKKDKERIIQTFIGVLTHLNDDAPDTMRELVKYSVPFPQDPTATAILKEPGEDTERAGLGMINIMSRVMSLLTDRTPAVQLSLPDDHNSVMKGFALMPPNSTKKKAYKLLTLRRNGTLGPLFINRKQVIPMGEWLECEEGHRVKGFSYRPGWHCAPKPCAPHLTTKGRIWAQVEIRDFKTLVRPQIQGGAWYLARHMRVIRLCKT